MILLSNVLVREKVDWSNGNGLIVTNFLQNFPFHDKSLSTTDSPGAETA